MTIKHYQQLDVWCKAMDLAAGIYALARQMPKQEEYRMTAQMVRAAISIPANIAEGHARSTRKDYAHFVSIAQGSTAELETLLLLARKTKLVAEDSLNVLLGQAADVGRMLNRLNFRLRNPSP